MSLLRKIVRNRACGLRWKESLRAAMLDRQLARCLGRRTRTA